MSRRRALILFISLSCLGQSSRVTAEFIPPQESVRKSVEWFEKRIRPVLADKCYSCHSARANKSEGALQLDSAEALRRGGERGPVIALDAPGESRLIQVLKKAHPESRPPKERLVSPGVILDLETWIRLGALGPRAQARAERPTEEAAQRHWAFQPLSRPQIPAVKDKSWAKDPLDAFVLAKLEQNRLRPSSPAERSTWIRRVSFDLVGLPPTPAEMDAFLADATAGAFERVVDRLLNSTQFGEHWGRSWLELAGYADFSAVRQNALHENAWRYRDYVVSALNKDKPYDVFVREQLAGDLLPASDEVQRREHLIATAFLMVGSKAALEGKTTRVTMDVVDDQVDVTTRAVLALTVSCARCHDHTSDPISMREYYGLAGIFTSTASFAEFSGEGRRTAPHWLERSLASPDQEKEQARYDARLKELQDEWREAREMKIAFPGDIDSAALAGVVVDNLAAEIQGTWKESNYSTNFVDRNYLHDGDADKGKKAVRFVPELPKEGLYEVLVAYTPRANRATNVPVTIRSKQGVSKVLLNQTLAPTRDKAFTTVGKYMFSAGTNGAVTISNEGTKGFVVADAVRFVPIDPRAGQGKGAAGDQDAPDMALLNFREIEKEWNEFKGKRPILPQAMAVQEGRIRDTKVRVGGDPDHFGDEVPRGFLSALGTPDSTLYVVTDESSGRLELAYWLTNPQNPLTARVAANRVWGHLFGKGLVATTSDFGLEGARPTHPELLDHLAGRFISEGWSMKKLIRAIVLSSAYRMASDPVAAGMASDPDNQLLWRMNPRSLEPEVLRDALLSVSGELDRTPGGPWLATNQVGATPLQAARRVQINSFRRSLYLPVIHDRPADVLRALSFNDPNPGSFRPVTSLSTPPPARFGSDRVVSERIWTWSDALIHTAAPSSAARVTLAFRMALGRPPSAEESAAAMQVIEKPPGPPESSSSKRTAASATAGWEALCGRLIASPEFRLRQ